MKGFKYIACDLSGQHKEGYNQAECSDDVLAWLRGQGLTPISISELFDKDQRSQKARQRNYKVKSADLAALCWQLSAMTHGGVAITTALEVISEDVENLQLQEVLQQVVEMVREGQSLSESISEFPKIFNQLSRAMLSAGETSGDLSLALQRMAQYYDNRDRLARKVKGAMAYPVFVLSFIVLIVIFIMAFIIPRFRSIFDQIGGELPAFTRGFMGFYDTVRFNLHFIIGFVLLAAISAVMVYTKTRKGHYWFSKILLSVPLIGKIVSQSFVSMFCRTMATLLGVGVPVLGVFDILSKMTNNDVIKTAVVQSKEGIIKGLNVSSSVFAAGFFPNMVVKMIQVGEESGSLSEVLNKTADYYERKVNSTIDTVMGLMEPIMIVTVGAIVMVVVLALYLPIFSMSKVG